MTVRVTTLLIVLGASIAAGPAEALPKIRILYLVPSDKTPDPRYVAALKNAIESVQIFYRNELANAKSFALNDPVVEVLATPHAASWYSTHTNGEFHLWLWNNVLEDGFALTGGTFDDPQNRWVFYIDADPACNQLGGGGTTGVAVMAANDLRGLAGKDYIPPCPDGSVDTAGPCRWIGGLGHELGHAFNLPHPPACHADEPGCLDSTLMWLGYTNYPDTFLAADDKLRLNQSSFLDPLDLTTTLPSCVATLAGALISATKTVSGDFTEGGTVTYAVTLSNAGGAQADNAGDEFTDTLPAGLTLSSAMASGGTVATNGNTVTWNGSIPSSSTVTITIQATIGAATAGTQISNQGTFRYDSNGDNTNDASGLTDDPRLPGLSDPTVFLVASSLMADLAVSKTNGQPDSVPGQTTTYETVVSNSGPSNAVGAVVTDIFDAAKFDTSAVVWTCDAAAPPGGATGCPMSGDGDDLAAGVSVNIGVGDAVAFSVEAPVLMTATGTLENTATVDSDSDPNDSNDTDTDVDNLLVLGPCGAPTDRALANQVVVTQQVFEACESIEAGPNFRIGLFGDATFRVGIEIILKNGFSIESGAKFVAEIDASLSN